MSVPVRIRLVVNGTARDLDVDPRRALVHVLRDQLGLMGTRFGCLTGHCGACTVMLNGYAVKSCTVLAPSADGDRVDTIEGLSRDGRLHPLQQAFWDRFGFQCGFCTPGMIMAALEVLQEDPGANDATLRRALSGNLCRCTGYQSIVDAVKTAAAVMTADKTNASRGQVR